jgi:hypothetical protein
MSRSSRRDYLQRIYARYQKASRPEKQAVLDEFCTNCSYQGKHAIRLLNRSLPEAKLAPRRRVRAEATVRKPSRFFRPSRKQPIIPGRGA